MLHTEQAGVGGVRWSRRSRAPTPTSEPDHLCTKMASDWFIHVTTVSVPVGRVTVYLQSAAELAPASLEANC